MAHNPTRREVLQFAVSPAVVAFCVGRSKCDESRSPNNKLNIGVIGVGNRGASNIAELKSENIAALCDVDRSYLEEMSARHPGAKTYEDFRELVDQTNLDAVLISTPDHTHYHAAMLAMRRGLHVYCEKPLAHSVWEVRELAKAANAAEVITQTGNQHHASEGYHRVVEIIQSGVLGSIREVHAWTTRPIWPQGIERPATRHAPPDHLNWDLWLGPAPQRPYDQVYHPRGWRGWFDFGCGVLGDMGPHLLDSVMWALNLDTPMHISAETSGKHAETFPQASTVRFKFGAGSEHAALDLVWYDGDRQPPESVTGIKRLPKNGVMFLGERGKLFAPAYGGRPTVLPEVKGDKIELPEPSLPRSPGHHQEWLSACKGNGNTGCDFSYGSRLTELCLLGNLAIRTGRAFEWDGTEPRGEEANVIAPLLRRDYVEGYDF